MNPRIAIPREETAAFCGRHRIRRLALFGSALRDDYGPDSDIDVLVEFEPGAPVGYIGLAGMEIELSRLYGGKVEMHTTTALHPGYRDEVLREAQVLYEQA